MRRGHRPRHRGKEVAAKCHAHKAQPGAGAGTWASEGEKYHRRHKGRPTEGHWQAGYHKRLSRRAVSGRGRKGRGGAKRGKEQLGTKRGPSMRPSLGLCLAALALACCVLAGVSAKSHRHSLYKVRERVWVIVTGDKGPMLGVTVTGGLCQCYSDRRQTGLVLDRGPCQEQGAVERGRRQGGKASRKKRGSWEKKSKQKREDGAGRGRRGRRAAVLEEEIEGRSGRREMREWRGEAGRQKGGRGARGSRGRGKKESRTQGVRLPEITLCHCRAVASGGFVLSSQCISLRLCLCVSLCVCLCVRLCVSVSALSVSLCAPVSVLCVCLCLCAFVLVPLCACAPLCLCAFVLVPLCACVPLCLCPSVLVCLCACAPLCLCAFVLVPLCVLRMRWWKQRLCPWTADSCYQLR